MRGAVKHDPAVTLAQMRNRILGGSTPQLDALSTEELVAANEMISRGEAKIIYHSCRQFLSARQTDDLSGFGELTASFKRLFGAAKHPG